MKNLEQNDGIMTEKGYHILTSNNLALKTCGRTVDKHNLTVGRNSLSFRGLHLSCFSVI